MYKNNFNSFRLFSDYVFKQDVLEFFFGLQERGRSSCSRQSKVIIVLLAVFSLTLVLTSFSVAQAASLVSIQDGDEWYYMTNNQAPPHKWHGVDFEHSHWQKGLSGFGYGSQSSRTILRDMQGNYLTVYARREFSVDNPEVVHDMNLSVICDGPFIAYLNDLEIIRTNTIQEVPAGESAGVQHAEPYNMNGFIHELNRGKNIISIQCDNDDIHSEDFTFIPVFEVLENKEVQK